MDLYRRGGDSLQGRYHHYRLHPFSAAEASGSSAPRRIVPGEQLEFAERGDADLIASLMEYGGFPEPFLAHPPRTLRRWQKERLDRLFREDARDLESIRDLTSMQEMADILPERVGSPLGSSTSGNGCGFPRVPGRPRVWSRLVAPGRRWSGPDAHRE
jgi:predicted AAA+ superfamily ATPase